MLSVVLALAILAVFAHTLSNGFVNYDDPVYVTANPHVQQGLTPGGLAWAFTNIETGNWHPLTWLTHMLEWQVFASQQWGYHLTSVLLHALNTVLVFRRMTRATSRSFLLAAFFGLHPLRVESVAWIAEQKDLLSAAFGLLALSAYVRYAETDHGPPPTARLSKSSNRGLEPENQGAGNKTTVQSGTKKQKSKIPAPSPTSWLWPSLPSA
jgi:hypothetical protein